MNTPDNENMRHKIDNTVVSQHFDAVIMSEYRVSGD